MNPLRRFNFQSNDGMPAAPVRGERRQVTALFYDIVNSTSLLNVLDAEEFAVAQRAIHAHAKASIDRHGGYLDRILGDGGCAYFGYPVATEDAAQAAVAAALSIAESSSEAAHGIHLRVRVGVATGMVVLSNAEGTGLPTHDEIVGIAPALAARIQAEASPGTALVSETTYAVTKSAFLFEPKGHAVLKGFSEPHSLYRAVARRPTPDRFSARRMPDQPLVAREEELELCYRRWLRAKSGAGQVAVVTGEPGIGKSRLVAELRRQVEGEGGDVRVLQCQPRGELQLLHPFLSAVRQHLDLLETSVTGQEAVKDLVEKALPEAGSYAPLLAFLLASHEPTAAQPAIIADLNPDEAQAMVLDASLCVLKAWARGKDQLLVIEDFHWADSMTRALLAALVEEVGELRRFIIVTSRLPAPAMITGEPHVLTIALSRLDETAVDQIVEAVWSPRIPPRDVTLFIRARSDGVPLFVEEVAQHLKERIREEEQPSTWQQALKDEGIVSLRDFIAARLAGLGAARRTAQVASVFGREFTREQLGALLQIADDRLDGDLETLVEAGLIRNRDHLGSSGFRFRHLLIQEAAYLSLLRSERRELHAKIIDLAATGRVSKLSDAALASHCEGAGRWIDATRFALRAAEACAIRCAPREAIGLLDLADVSLERASDDPQATELTLQALATRGSVTMVLHGKGSPEARAVYSRGIQLAETLPPGERNDWFALYWGWWITAPDTATQLDRSQTLIRNAASAGDAEVRLQSFHCGWATAFDAGEHSQCLHCIEQGLALYDAQRAVASRAIYGGHDARVCGLGERALSLWFTGRTADIGANLDDAIAWAEAVDHPGSICHALEYQALYHWLQGEPEPVADVALRIATIAERHDLALMQAKSQVYRGWALAHLSGLDAGMAQFFEALEKLRRIDTEESASLYADMKADLLGRSGETDRAIAVLDQVIGHQTTMGQRFWLPELYRRRAMFRHRRGEGRGTAIGDLSTALSIAHEQGALRLAARVSVDLEAIMRDGAVDGGE
ncbi:MAG TPA: AAA family ATPase [Microvirga sp.]|jgi:predicted ATPase/class 3 adenylate cyclase|nr:AAA family ATPase [Microvirga sp.]